MTSSDREILIAIDGKVTALGERLDHLEARVAAVERRIETLSIEVQHNTDRIDWVQTTVYWGFAMIAFIVGAIPIVQGRNHDQSPHGGLSFRDVKDIIKSELREREAEWG